jgi:ABC-type Fe3+ transport system permease subunit
VSSGCIAPGASVATAAALSVMPLVAVNALQFRVLRKGSHEMSAFRLVAGIRSRYGGPAGHYTTTSALAVLLLFPLVWSGWSSVKEQPGSPQGSGYGFGNYAALLQYGEGLGTYALNSAIVSVLTVIGTLVVSSLGGYAFARFTFPGKSLLFLATLAIYGALGAN